MNILLNISRVNSATGRSSLAAAAARESERGRALTRPRCGADLQTAVRR